MILSPSSRTSSKLVGAACVLALVLAACGGASPSTDSPPPKSPASETSPKKELSEPKSVEEAQAQIAQLRDEFDFDDAKKKPATEAPPHKSADKAEPSASSREEHLDASGTNACGNSCRALTSMKRAVDALCRMTGDSDNRCVEAKKTLTDSTTRVSSCKCAP